METQDVGMLLFMAALLLCTDLSLELNEKPGVIHTLMSLLVIPNKYQKSMKEIAVEYDIYIILSVTESMQEKKATESNV